MAKSKITQADLDRIRKENKALREKLEAQQKKTASVKEELASAKAEAAKANNDIKKLKKKAKELEAKIKKVEASTKAIDKKLAAEDRKADRTTGRAPRQSSPKPKKKDTSTPKQTFKELERARQVDKTGRIISPGIARGANNVPLTVKLPTASDMLDLSSDELLELLQSYGIVEPWDSLRANAARSTGALRNIPNKALFDAQLLDIIDGDSKRGVLSLARRTQERYNTLSILDGDPGTLLMRLPDDYDPDRLCDNCEALAATIGTYEEHAAIGLPGAQSCLGADYCRCSLVAVTEE